MRGNKFLFTGILVLFGIILLSTSFVSAANAVTLVTPAASSNISGTTYVLNATLDTNTVNLSHAWFYYIYNNGTPVTIATHVINTTNGVFLTTWNSATAKDGTNITFSVTVTNETGNWTNTTDDSTGVTIANTAPYIYLVGYVNGTIKNNTGTLTLNTSVLLGSNMSTKTACKFNINGTNLTSIITVKNATHGTCNTTAGQLTNLGDGNHTIYIYANNSAGLWGQIGTSAVFTDTESPSVGLTATELNKDSITLAIDVTDGSGIGVSSCTVDRTNAVVSGTTSLTETGLSCATAYTYVVECVDKNGHASSVQETYSTLTCGGGAVTSGGSTTKPVVNSVATMTPGSASVVKYTDSTLGVKQISIEVNNPAQNVQISVTKEAGKPAEVSIAKSGKIYQYLHIETTNLADKLSKATVQFKVEKSWTTANNVDKNNVVASKFDETNKKWNELTTTYVSEDSTHYYYNVELDSFSYFVLSDKTTTVPSEEVEEGTEAAGGSLTWLWIVIAVVIIVALWYLIKRKK